MEEDRTETVDLAEQHPEIVRRLAASYVAWAKRCNIVPWDDIKNKLWE